MPKPSIEKKEVFSKSRTETGKYLEEFWKKLKKKSEGQIFKEGERPNEIKISDALNKDPNLRKTANLSQLPTEIHRIRAVDQKTGEKRTGTRRVVNGVIGYFTEKNEYIAVGEGIKPFGATQIEILEVLSLNDPRLEKQRRLEKAVKEQKSKTRKGLFGIKRNIKKEATLNLPPNQKNRRNGFGPDPTMKLKGAYIRKPKLAMPLKETIRHTQKRNHPIEAIVVHDTDSNWTLQQAVGFFQNAKVQTHYVIDKKGNIAQIVPDNEIARHTKGRRKDRAGIKGWVNGKSIGIDFVNNGMNKNGEYDPYTDAQYRAFARLTAHLMTRYGIKPEKIVAHRFLDPGARGDPSPTFNWPWVQKETKRQIVQGPKEKIKMPKQPQKKPSGKDKLIAKQ